MEIKLETTKKVGKIVRVISSRPLDSWLGLIIRVLAILVSWFFNKSILWAIFHYFLGFWYLLYKLLTGAFKDGNFMTIFQNYF